MYVIKIVHEGERSSERVFKVHKNLLTGFINGQINLAEGFCA